MTRIQLVVGKRLRALSLFLLMQTREKEYSLRVVGASVLDAIDKRKNLTGYTE